MDLPTRKLNARLKQTCWVAFKSGIGGIAGMVAVMEDELVKKRKRIDQQHFMDVVSTLD